MADQPSERPSSEPIKSAFERLQELAARAPHLPGIAALVVIGAIYLAISEGLSVAPTWLLLICVIVAAFAIVLARRSGRHKVTHTITLVLIAATTVLVVSSAAILTTRLSEPSGSPLLFDATLIWVANVLTFAVWYWTIDAGGPHERQIAPYRTCDFIFAQMTLSNAETHNWSPGFIDYLFLAFNTSTAFSPTATLPLSHRVKLLMMLQTVVSLAVILVLAARAINGLPG